jgi:hypothetical protein
MYQTDIKGRILEAENAGFVVHGIGRKDTTR